ncbi:hypothetical protein PO369_03855 [Phytobacter diazotrophicus]|nr:hypothetical protein MRY16398_06850 [Phytobacter sp. MRY16-398]
MKIGINTREKCICTRLDPGSYPLLRSEIEEKKTRSARFLSEMHRGGAIIASFSRSDKSGKLGSFKALLYKSAA